MWRGIGMSGTFGMVEDDWLCGTVSARGREERRPQQPNRPPASDPPHKARREGEEQP